MIQCPVLRVVADPQSIDIAEFVLLTPVSQRTRCVVFETLQAVAAYPGVRVEVCGVLASSDGNFASRCVVEDFPCFGGAGGIRGNHEKITSSGYKGASVRIDA